MKMRKWSDWMNNHRRPKQIYHRWLRKLSRSKWSIRLLGLPTDTNQPANTGVLMIQIDGLSSVQFQRALLRGRMPFVKKLILDHKVRQAPFYAGLPSATPAVQAELFYGVKTAVPAFEFIDRKTGNRHAMFRAASVNTVVHRLSDRRRPLLEGGSSYSNIYSGGARTAKYCAETISMESMLKSANPLKVMLVLFFHIGKLLRVIGYSLIELNLAVYDFFKGLVEGRHFLKELKFVPTRVFVCAILREMIRFRVKMDLARGVPIICANFFGYDEQSHRRGPDSAFAHWTLKGIDGVVRDLYKNAQRSNHRNYRVVIYSDHGQQRVAPYQNRFGRSVKTTIREIITPHVSGASTVAPVQDEGRLESFYRRAGNLFSGHTVLGGRENGLFSGRASSRIRITTMGPLSHVYLPRPRAEGGTAWACERTMAGDDRIDLHHLARRLNQQAAIPLVLFRKDGSVMAVNEDGTYDLSAGRRAAIGADHPFLDETARDLKNLCLHPDAGDLVLSGWRPGRTPLSFNTENGAHGGPGTEETSGFVLLPSDVKANHSFLRPNELRTIILQMRDVSSDQ